MISFLPEISPQSDLPKLARNTAGKELSYRTRTTFHVDFLSRGGAQIRDVILEAICYKSSRIPGKDLHAEGCLVGQAQSGRSARILEGTCFSGVAFHCGTTGLLIRACL